jgi:hypothetical protein
MTFRDRVDISIVFILIVPALVMIGWLVWYLIVTGLWVIMLPTSIIAGYITWRYQHSE